MTINDFKTNVPLAPYTTLGIGGHADYFFEARSDEDVVNAVVFAKEKKMPFAVIGGGSNVLVSDLGFRGLAIITRNNAFEIKDERIRAGAGVPIATLMARCAKEGYAGLEWAAGLPGTLGGAIVGNAGTFGKSMADVIFDVRVVNEAGEIKIMSNSECGFGYRTSAFQKMPGVVIVSAQLRVMKGDAQALVEEIKKNAMWRAEHHPAYKSCGCVFRNTEATSEARIPQEGNQPVQWFDKVPAGWLVDRAGLKGAKHGGFTISDVHGNFFVNDGTGTASDLLALIAETKRVVKEKFNVELEEEVRKIGF